MGGINLPEIAPEPKSSQEQHDELEECIAPAIPGLKGCRCKDLRDVIYDTNPKKVDKEVQPVYMMQKLDGVESPRHRLIRPAWTYTAKQRKPPGCSPLWTLPSSGSSLTSL
jgi:hypothetical protein